MDSLDPAVVATTPAVTVRPSPAPMPAWALRVLSAMLGGLCATLLIIAAILTPSPDGVGTHRQLHLPPCGFLLTTGLPCPTCGYTTAFSYAAHGRLLASFHSQPAGAATAIVAAITVVICLITIVTGASPAWMLRPLARPVVFWVAGGLFLGGWAYKILLVKGFIR